MLKGMTSYAEREVSLPKGQLRVVVRTVNGRFLEPRIKLPSGMGALEAMAVLEVKSFIKRWLELLNIFSKASLMFLLKNL